MRDAKRPLFYVGDGVWKSGAEAQATALAEHCGAAVATLFGDMRGVPIKHPLHCGPFEPAVAALDPDLIVCIGVRHGGSGRLDDYQPFTDARRVIAIGPDVENFENIPGLDLAILADEGRTLARLQALMPQACYDERQVWAKAQAARLREARRESHLNMAPQPSRVRPLVLAQALDGALERRGGGLVMIEQFALPLDCLGKPSGAGNNVYVRPAGGSEGYGIGAAAGLKLAAPDRPVVGLVGDGSLFYADSGLWTAVHHAIPVLYVIPNNQSYGIVANFFGLAEGAMKQAGEYAGVVLDGIDPVTDRRRIRCGRHAGAGRILRGGGDRARPAGGRGGTASLPPGRPPSAWAARGWASRRSLPSCVRRGRRQRGIIVVDWQY